MKLTEYIVPIQTAFLLFPFVAFLITIPYMLVQYRKFGSVPILRTVIVYSFVLYLLTTYFLVILPLPPVSEVANYTTPTMQLVPFQFVTDMIQESNFVWNAPRTYIEIIKNPVIYQVLYNVLMVLPFGFYLRYYFKRNLLQTIGVSFLLSLFFEITQLSGLYGIYPRGYRLFDIDDLMINTFGGALGYLITPCIAWILPTREQLDRMSYEKGKRISFLRRLFAFVIDGIILFGLYMMIDLPSSSKFLDYFFESVGLSTKYVLTIMIYFMILLPIMHGSSIGKRIVKMKVVSDTGKEIKWWQCMIRYGVLYLILIPMPFILNSLITHFNVNIPLIYFMILILIILLTVIYGCFLIDIFISIFDRNKLLLYEKLSHTKNISTIQVEDSNQEQMIVEKMNEEV